MKSLRILIDIDDTITNLGTAWVSWLNMKYGTNVSWREITDWEIDKFFPEITKSNVFEPLVVPEFWDTVKPKDGAIEYVKKLIDDGHEVYIVTSSIYSSVKTKFDKVLFKYFPYIDWKHVIIAYNKQMIKGDVMIDDGPHNLIGGEYTKILMDAPHNQEFDAEASGMKRVFSWKGAYKAILQISRKEGELENE